MNPRLQEIHKLKGKAQTRDELLALEQEQAELELEMATQPDATPVIQETEEELTLSEFLGS
jgi:hypothetical protein